MIRNYLKIAWRNALKHKVFSLINILGLSIGIAVAFLVGAFIRQELLVNSNIRDNERVCLLVAQWKLSGLGLDFTTPAPLAKALKENYPQLVENYYHHDGISSIVSRGDQRFSESLQPGDSTFLNITGFPLLYGDATTAMDDPDALVITARTAIKYFGKTDVVGQTLNIQSFAGSKKDFRITGVLKDLPFNTITSFNTATNDFFLPASSLRFFGRDISFNDWNNVYIVNYVKLKEGVSPTSLQKPIEHLLQQHTPPGLYKNLSVSLSPVSQHYRKLNNNLAYRMIYTLAAVAAFILLMAMINFINISIGNSITRLREIGVRKVMGGLRKQLIGQFLTETTLFVSLSVVVALLMYHLARPFFIDLLGKEIPSITGFPLSFMIIPVGITLLIGILAGLYPAVVLSLQPSIASLKGKLSTIKEKVIFRRSLIGVQFITAIIVFVAAIVIDRQVNFFFKSDLGYDKEAVLTVRVPRDWTPKGVAHMTTVRNEFMRLKEISNASFAYEIMDGMSGSNTNNLYPAAKDSTAGIIAEGLTTDEKFAATYAVPVVAGSYFNDNGVYDSTNIVLNMTAVKQLGWNDAAAALGQHVRIAGDPRIYVVSGVVKDFHFGTFHSGIRPILVLPVQNKLVYRYLSFKLKPGNLQSSIEALQQKWSTLFPEAPFDYNFMDDALARWYKTELQMKQASRAATIISLLIVGLGILGIVVLNINRRTKEVGIRKVLGASVPQVMALFFREFTWIMVLANLVAWPLAWLLLNRWLADYAYRISIGVVPFLIVGSSLVLLVAAIIAAASTKTALDNPVKSLRTE